MMNLRLLSVYLAMSNRPDEKGRQLIKREKQHRDVVKRAGSTACFDSNLYFTPGHFLPLSEPQFPDLFNRLIVYLIGCCENLIIAVETQYTLIIVLVV